MKMLVLHLRSEGRRSKRKHGEGLIDLICLFCSRLMRVLIVVVFYRSESSAMSANVLYIAIISRVKCF
jgi:hypothetical protein